MNENSKENEIKKVIFNIHCKDDISGNLFPYLYQYNSYNIDKLISNDTTNTNNIYYPWKKKLTKQQIKKYIIKLQKNENEKKSEEVNLNKKKNNEKEILKLKEKNLFQNETLLKDFLKTVKYIDYDDEKIKEIRLNNLKIIIDIFFPLYSNLIFSNSEINKNFTITKITHTENEIKLHRSTFMSYKEIINHIQNKELDNLKEIRKQLMDDKLINGDYSINDSKRPSVQKILKQFDIENDKIHDKIDNEALELAAQTRRYNIMANTINNNKNKYSFYNYKDKNINDYINELLKPLNNKAKDFDIEYEYKTNKGILLKGINNISVYKLTIDLSISKDSIKKKFNFTNKLSCKERLKNIKNLYKKIKKTIKKNPNKKSKIKYELVNNKLREIPDSSDSPDSKSNNDDTKYKHEDLFKK